MLNRNKVSVYTTLIILKDMRERLGIEAMLSFLEKYVTLIEKRDPGIKEAVSSELKDRALVSLYEVVCADEEKIG
ncbi:MAG: hypothetical protein HQL16_01820 [Candidatus Omnitrophica bacterium]|nr:hypothetical protein [Candidatus Omnitrophota bacterium]